MQYRIGVDIGGTHIKAAVVDRRLKILNKVKCRTNLPKTAKEMQKDIKNLIYLLLRNSKIDLKKIESIGIGCPGIVNPKKKVVEYACNLNFYKEDFAKNLEEKLQKPIYIENDATAAALGEYLYRKFKDVSMVLITLGTGIGGGVILDGKIYRGFNFSGAEVGHMVIKEDGRECSCGRKGCFEKYASATGLATTIKEIMNQEKDSVLWQTEKEEGKVTGKMVFKAAKLGDVAALKAIDIFIKDLSIGVSNLINIFQPEFFVIGGGLSKEGKFILEPLKKIVEKDDYARNLKNRCKIEMSEIGNGAGLIGASQLFKIF